MFETIKENVEKRNLLHVCDDKEKVPCAMDSLYLVCIHGYAFNKLNTRQLRVRLLRNSYVIISLSVRKVFLHSAIARTFMPEDYDFEHQRVIFLDGDRSNCAVSNLKVVTAKEQHRYNKKLKEAIV